MHKKAYGKINWALAVYGERPDGYHEIDTVMQKVSLADTVILAEGKGEMSLSVSGSREAGVPRNESNLAWRAAEAYRHASDLDCFWKMHIQKEIPHGAGLGGASADAAAVLFLLEEKYGSLGKERLFSLASSLGADIPFLLCPHAAARCRGIGEKIEPFSAGGGLSLLLAMGHERVSTPRAYAGVEEREGAAMERAEKRLEALCCKIAEGQMEGLRELLFNDLQAPATALAPEIARLLEDLESVSPMAMAMTGSGAACMGLFRREEEANGAASALAGRWPFLRVCHTLAGT